MVRASERGNHDTHAGCLSRRTKIQSNTLSDDKVNSPTSNDQIRSLRTKVIDCRRECKADKIPLPQFLMLSNHTPRRTDHQDPVWPSQLYA